MGRYYYDKNSITNSTCDVICHQVNCRGAMNSAQPRLFVKSGLRYMLIISSGVMLMPQKTCSAESKWYWQNMSQTGMQ